MRKVVLVVLAAAVLTVVAVWDLSTAQGDAARMANIETVQEIPEIITPADRQWR